MKLHEAISELIKQFGTEILSERRLTNLLSDYLAFTDSPSLQQVVKDFVCDESYPALISRIVNGKETDIKTYIDKVGLDFQRRTKSKKDLVNYVIDSYLFGFGLTKTVRDPSTSGFDAYAQESSHILQGLHEQLDELKKAYVDMLEKLPTLSTDVVFDTASYYSVEAQNQLYALKLKIAVIADQLGVKGAEWCDDLYESKLKSFFDEKKTAVEHRLAEEKRKYSDEVENCIVKSENSYISKSGYLPSDADKKLKPIEDTIKKLNLMLGVVNDSYCQNERTRILAKYTVSLSKRSKQIAIKIIVPAAIVLGSLFTGSSYMSSQDAIDTFDSQMTEIQKLNESGQYAESIARSLSARDGYTASFMTSSYKNDAMESANLAFNNLCAQADKLISEGKYFDANQLIESVPVSYLNENPTSAEYVQTFKEKLAKVIPDGIEDLIQSTSNNSGHLSDYDKTKLDELLKLDPKNYWLNFIKNKQ